jgi:hypothetical protein
MGARAASIEAHLIACAECRSAATLAAPTERLTEVWVGIEERVDQPSKTWVEHLLVRARVPEEEARLLAAAPSLQVSWLVALGVVLTFAAAATHAGERGVLLFLLLAPLAPLAAVAGAYGRGIDPTYEVTRSTSYPAYRLLLLRASAVLLISIAITSVVALTATDAWIAAAWLLPSLALVGIVLTLSRWTELVVAASAVGAGYLVVVLGLWRGGESAQEIFQAPTQLLSVVLIATCVLLLFVPSNNRAALRRVP